MNEIKADSAAVPGRVRNAALIPAPGCLGSYRLRPPSASLAGALLVFATTIVPFGRASGQVTAHGCDGGDLGDECSLLELRDTLGGRFVVASPTRTYSMHSWRVSDDFPILGNPAQVRVSVDATDVDHPVIRFEAALPTALRNDDDSIVTNRSLLGRFAFDPVETTFVGTIEVSADFTVSAGDVSAICGDQPEGGSAAIAGTSIRPSEFALPVASAHVTLETAPVASAAVVPLSLEGTWTSR